MLIVIPGALPPLPVAAELARLLPQRAPLLHEWLQAATARVEGFDARAQGCTPFEAWQLAQAGYHPAAGTPVGAGLGPLRAGPAAADGQPVWLAELAHLALGTDQATLLDPEHMDMRAEEADALVQTARPSIESAGFAVQPLSPRRWRLRLPEGLAPPTASPAAVAGQPLRDWWSQDPAMRPWRRLLNEIQMAWHEHPANEARAARGAAPVNALWLYGGAAGWPARPAQPARVADELDAPHRAGDWAAWLDALAGLEQRHLRPLLAPSARLPSQPVQLILLGADRRATLSLQPRGRLLAWLPAPKKNWNTWWSRPV
ncbi:hypothetical protein J2P76_06600 [Bordetella petrii]|nr:hypothetical protein [Bordetella petrii]MBO1111605.1 hypothetical protein [Bordetella petrii]